VDARLVRVLTINIYRNRAESFQTFDYITQQGNFSWLEREVGRVLGAATMWWVLGLEPAALHVLAIYNTCKLIAGC
jgi:hypothetical protein